MKQIDMNIRRIMDIAKRAYQSNCYTYTDFLNINELSEFNRLEKDFAFIEHREFGGLANSERKMIQFGSMSEFGYEEEFPIEIIKISPLSVKFASECSHRDYLGALMNLGIDRSLIGDIKIDGLFAYVFCVARIANLICESIDKVSRVSVKSEIVTYDEEEKKKIEEIFNRFEEREILVASERVDAVVAALTRLSRSQAVELFRTGKVFINGCVNENNSYYLKPQDELVIRGYGKYIFVERHGESRKGRLYIKIKVYA